LPHYTNLVELKLDSVSKSMRRRFGELSLGPTKPTNLYGFGLGPVCRYGYWTLVKHCINTYCKNKINKYIET